MPDMLVNLRKIKSDNDLESELGSKGIKIVRATVPDRNAIVKWMGEQFSPFGAGECAVAFSRVPVSCYIAIHEKKIIGCACYNSTAPDFFGPTVVDEKHRGKGIGKVLLVKSLLAMFNEGYQYAIIGSAGPVKFYEETVQAIAIENEGASLYDDFFAFQ